MKNFQQHFKKHLSNLLGIVSSTSDDRREWLRLKLANSLLFGSGAAFFFHSTAPSRNEAALNEAIALREAAYPLYEGNDERLAADIESIVRYYEPKAPIAVDRKKDARKIPAAVLANQEELRKRAEQNRILRTRIKPKLEGFLGGARYEVFQLQESEQAADRASNAASKAANALLERVNQDVLHCAEKWTAADMDEDDQAVAKWEAELLFAESDLKMITQAVKKFGWETQ